jgi:uncharacterized membrane protein
MPDFLKASIYEILKLLHISGAIVWIGAIITLEYLFTQAESARDAQGIRRLISFNAWLTKRLYVPASLSTIIFGVLATWQAWQFTSFWVLLGLVLYVIMFLMGVTYFSPQAERIMKMYEEGGDDSPVARAAVRKYMLLERLDMVVMYVALVDMVFKPQGADPRFLIVSAIGAVAFGLHAMRGYNKMAG